MTQHPAQAVCSFCGSTTHPIHPDSPDQYGEPVCTPCFNQSYQPDPDSSDPEWSQS